MKTHKSWLYLIPFLIFGGFIVMLYLRQGSVQQAGTSDIINRTALLKPVPNFELPLLSDPSRMMTNTDLPKEPYLLNVWGSWCVSCYAEHPMLLDMQADGVKMVGVNYKDELPDALAYLNEYHDPFLYSVQDLKGDLALDLGLTGAPESFIVDKDGKIRLHIVGVVDDNNYPNQIKPCLEALANNALDDQTQQQACGVV